MVSKKPSEGMRQLTLAAFAAAMMGTASFVPSPAMAGPLPSCTGLAAVLGANSNIAAVPAPTAAVIPAGGGHLAYCKVTFTVSEASGPAGGYLPGQKQAINIGVGLPLRKALRNIVWCIYIRQYTEYATTTLINYCYILVSPRRGAFMNRDAYNCESVPTEEVCHEPRAYGPAGNPN